MVQDVGYDFFGFIGIVAFIACCLMCIDANWQICSPRIPILNKERVIAALLILFLSLWQLWFAFNNWLPAVNQ
jgi:hypothetical protein